MQEIGTEGEVPLVMRADERRNWYVLFRALVAALAVAVIHSHSIADTKSKRKAKASETSLSSVLVQSASSILEGTFPKNACAEPGHRTSVGLWTFSDDDIPISEAAARRVYDELLVQIIKRKQDCIDVLDNAGIGIIMEHLSKSGALDQSGGNALAALEEAHQQVDFVLFPQFLAQGSKLYLSLRMAERKTGRTVAIAKPVLIPSSEVIGSASDMAKSIEAAVSDAASKLLQDTRSISEVTPAGLFYGDTHAQPEAARFLMDQLLGKLVEKGTNTITGKNLRVRAISVEAATPTPDAEEDVSPEVQVRNDGAHLLSGRYWIRGDAVELVMTLQSPDGSKKMWRGPIRLSEFQGMTLEPKNEAALSSPLPPSNYVFHVATTRGSNPVFKVGEELNLKVRLGRKAWVYCFYVDSANGVTPIFPLPRDLAGKRRNPLEPKRTMLLPDPRIDKFRFRFAPGTVGEEIVSCYATTRDVASELPEELFPPKPAVVPFLTLDAVRRSFERLNDAGVSEAMVTMTIAK